ncbi:HAD-superfamily subfamily IIA hydrolase [Puccinia triticina 1-1 BBBD Race 1]|uniref:HAD-superfamily subfamily IIA hydrolase n=2 Tax=Puccinia triticina TaxID=208348 RepID=A0A180G3J5_PUCT1|nr:uncharacterized protein PtA15_11A174 [Puccinia triticina]OAV87265.1 HAD-superfamily subfamily IIA hydrolase [Puccinia triticina 1-1 BBBD Race 1]WAQ89485.1 hypothetical protein PtA15_11A174 [Puccinia triticina]WAR59540.1 hypothetical protein PtB15_11B180 [Puccinia triticina]
MKQVLRIRLTGPRRQSALSIDRLNHYPNSYSTQATPPPAFCFDIDGVLKQGAHVLPQARKAIAILNGQNSAQKSFPFILCTNGGGTPELERSKKLSEELGVPITPSQLVQSHTIFNQFLSSYSDKPILVIGGRAGRCRLVAEGYGFQHVYIPQDILKWNPSIWPFYKLSDQESRIAKTADFSKIPFSAVFVMHDSFDWGLDTQMAIDVLTSKDGIITNPIDCTPNIKTNSIPVYFSNPDFLWGNEFSRPRFGQGAFQTALRANYERLTGHPLEAWTGGKPTRATYDFANQLLKNILRDQFNGQDLGAVYMIGDNPASDIQGANNYGWSSVLVKTGVFKGNKPEDAAHVPTSVQSDVLEAVHWALRQEGHAHVL